MKERPILFSGPMVRALLEGRKTQTRRVVKPMPCYGAKLVGVLDMSDFEPPYVSASFLIEEELASRPGAPQIWNESIPCPYGVPGDWLIVRETLDNHLTAGLVYDADRAEVKSVPPGVSLRIGKVPCIHMPRWASRITLEIVRVRVERVEHITEADAKAEGFGGCDFRDWAEGCAPPGSTIETARDSFLRTFYDLNERAPRGTNPWVWVIEFKRIGGAA